MCARSETYMNDSMKLLKWRSGLALLAGVFAAGSVFAQPEQWLQYHTSREGRSSRWMELSTNPPPDVDLPKLNAQPYFARWITPLDPAGGRWLCLDRTRKSGLYDRVYLTPPATAGWTTRSPAERHRMDQYTPISSRCAWCSKAKTARSRITSCCGLSQYEDDNANLLISSGGYYAGKVDHRRQEAAARTD